MAQTTTLPAVTTVQKLTSTDLQAFITAARNNPTRMFATVLAALEEVTNGTVRIVDPTNPFVYLMETSIAGTAAAIGQNAALTQRQYPSAAQNYTDLYRWMSDRDYLNRFSSPAIANFTFLFAYDEFVNKAVPDPTAPGTSMLVIPRYTSITVGGLAYTMQYPVLIRLMPHGGLQVTFDVSSPSPLYSLNTNVVGWNFIYDGPTKYIALTIPTYQLQLSTTTVTLNNAIGFSKVFNYPNTYHYVRAYIRSSAVGPWQEIATTHSAEVYDPTVPTLTLAVMDGQVQATIPQLYFNTGLVPDSVRVDIYTTVGPLNVNLQNYPQGSFSAEYLDLDSTQYAAFSSPLPTFSNMAIFCGGSASGGRLGLSFAELRDQVIVGGIAPNGVPITTAELSTAVSDAGFSLVTNVDNITTRMYLATAAVPAATKSITSSGVGCTIQLYHNTIAALIGEGGNVNNGYNWITILPNTLYRNNNGVISIVPYSTVQALRALPAAALADVVNSGQYLFSPFHYVLDVSATEFRARPYMLTSPKIITKFFVGANIPSLIGASAAQQDLSISTDGTGYTLTLQLANGSFNSPVSPGTVLLPTQCDVQISYLVPNSTTRVWINGTRISPLNTDGSVNGPYIYTFDIATDFIVDNDDNLLLTVSGEPIPLTAEFDIVYIARSAAASRIPGDIDQYTMVSQLASYSGNPDEYLGISHETMTVTFGQALVNLWANSRTIAAPLVPQVYTATVYATYQTDVLQRTTGGQLVLTYDSVSGQAIGTKIHSAGDPVYESDGVTPVVLHAIGDPVMIDGVAQYQNDGVRGLQQQIDMFFVDGRYYFATDATTQAELNVAVQTVVGWVGGAVTDLKSLLLEESTIFFYPKASLGTTDVIVNDGSTATIDIEQTLLVTYSVPKATLKNMALRATITATTKARVSALFESSTLSLDDITTDLRSAMGGDVVSVAVAGFMGNQYDVVTMTDSSSKLAIAKQLVVLPSLALQVQDNIDVKFVLHGKA